MDKIEAMPRQPAQPKQTFTVRLDPEQVARIRAFVRDYAGKPFYLTLHGLVAQAVEREMQRIEAQAAGASTPEPSSTVRRSSHLASNNHRR